MPRRFCSCRARSRKATTPAGAARNAAFTLDARMTIVVDEDEPGPVHLAATIWPTTSRRSSGRNRKIADHAGESGATVLIGEAAKLPGDKRPANLSDPESFSIAVSGKDLVLSAPICAERSTRCTSFSQEYLGVDPMYYWTDHEPPRRTRIDLPATLNKAYPAPVFKYRGFFINDEDLLTGWAPGAKDHAGISLEAWNKVYETSLRLKANMVVPGTWIFSRRSADQSGRRARTDRHAASRHSAGGQRSALAERRRV